MSTYVLVHGAWQGAWCWDKVAPLIRSAGHTVFTPDLPGHGEKLSSDQKITAEDYVDSLVNLITGLDQPVVLTGHSMAGMVISQTAEYIPEQIKKLVYVSGFLLENGQSIREIESEVADSLVSPNIILSSDRLSLSIPPDLVRVGLYSDCTDTDFDYAYARIQPQPLLPFITPIKISKQRYGSIPRIYIECVLDKALPIGAQRKMLKTAGCDETYTLVAAHSPFFSVSNDLVEILLQI